MARQSFKFEFQRASERKRVSLTEIKRISMKAQTHSLTQLTHTETHMHTQKLFKDNKGSGFKFQLKMMKKRFQNKMTLCP